MVDAREVTPGHAPYKEGLFEMSAGPTLLLTRPMAQSQSFQEQCTAHLERPISAVVSPVIDIRPVTGEPDLSGATLVVTSSNAVHAISKQLNGRRVAAVGQATAELAASFGAVAECMGETVDELLEKSQCLTSPIVVARGVHARLDLTAELTRRGHSARAVTVYDQAMKPLSLEARALLLGSHPVIAPVFSPRSAALLSKAEILAPIKVLAISKNAADAWRGPGEILIAKRPTAQSMCELVAQVV